MTRPGIEPKSPGPLANTVENKYGKKRGNERIKVIEIQKERTKERNKERNKERKKERKF